ncbi:MAG: hypothetical protein JNG86_05815, partial [Verrucomicrobiaceae bacterium]|nr:hypothetical protein [Verrucomicrobiaceae bacterium]
LPWPLWALGLCSFGISETKLWLLMWLALAGMSLPACLASLHGLDLGRQSRRVVAWSFETLSMLVVWLAAIAALHPRPLTGGVMRVFRPLIVNTHAQAAETLSRPDAILHAGGILLSVALALHLIACALRIGTEKTPA